MGISVRCVRGAGNKEAPKVQDGLIPTEHIAVLRGTAILDELYHHRTRRTIRTPYVNVIDGEVLEVLDPQIASGKYLVKAVTISITRPGKIVMTFELEGEYEEP